MAEENRRTMQIRLSIDERTLVLEGLERVRNSIRYDEGDLRQIDALVARVASLK